MRRASTPFREPAGRAPLRRHEAEARPGLHPDPHPGPPGPGRAHHRRGPRLPTGLLEAPRPAPARGPDHPPDHPLPGRGRALRPRGPHEPGRLLTLDDPGRLRSQVDGSFLEVVARPRRRGGRGAAGSTPRWPTWRSSASRLHVSLPATEPGRAAEAARRLRRAPAAQGDRGRVGPGQPPLPRGRLHPAHSGRGRRHARPQRGDAMTRRDSRLPAPGRGPRRVARSRRRRPRLPRAPEPATRPCQRALDGVGPAARAQQLEVAAGADVDGARAARWPAAEVAAGYTRRSNIDQFLIPQPAGQPPVGFLNLPNNYALSARGNLPVYAGGRISGQIDGRHGERARRRPGPRRQPTEAGPRDRDRLLEAGDGPRERARAPRSARRLRGPPEGRTQPSSASGWPPATMSWPSRWSAIARSCGVCGQRTPPAVAEANLARLLQLPPGAVVEPTETLERLPPVHEDLEAPGGGSPPRPPGEGGPGGPGPGRGGPRASGPGGEPAPARGHRRRPATPTRTAVRPPGRVGAGAGTWASRSPCRSSTGAGPPPRWPGPGQVSRRCASASTTWSAASAWR